MHQMRWLYQLYQQISCDKVCLDNIRVGYNISTDSLIELIVFDLADHVLM